MVGDLMARIRTIKPELWTDPEFVECSTNARLLFVAALNFASDYGVMADKPVQLKMQCFPGDDIAITPLIEELIDAGFWIRRPAPDGTSVLVIRTFLQHQRVDKPQDGRWGDPSDWPSIAECSPNVRRLIPEGSTTEGNGRKGDIALPPLPDDFAAWYAQYPRKKARADALKAWKAIAAPRPTVDELIAACAGLRKLPKHEEKFIPYPASWIRDRRWEDESPDPTDTPQRDGKTFDEHTGAWISNHTVARS